jgi:large subunit ribosomal protein L2
LTFYLKLPRKNDKFARIKLPSGEQRLVSLNNQATLGSVSNINHRYIVLGKAGRARWKNKRPIVRGVAMNPVDHPHGGGEGKTSGGRPSVTPWGKPTKGQSTSKFKNKRPYILVSYKNKKLIKNVT